jgi:20S proteasome alpha/beta subunit
MYLHEHNKDMSSTAVAAMLSTILYYRRFFPYYVYNIVAGIDDEGNHIFALNRALNIMLYKCAKEILILKYMSEKWKGENIYSLIYIVL